METDADRALAKKLWRLVEEDNAEGMDFFLPPTEIGPSEDGDENGRKKVIEYNFNEEGKKIKITITTRTIKVKRERLALERRAWAKFGDAAAPKDSNSRLSKVSAKEIFLERPGAPGSKVKEPKSVGDLLATMVKAGPVFMFCRTCGKKGYHWTSKCPYKDLVRPTDTFTDKPPTAETSSTYVPPHMRAGADRSGFEMRRRNDENSVRVTNLSEDTQELDLHELFGTFGPVSRAYVAVDQKTGVSRGFGFVNFVHRQDARKAINKLDGYGYDHLILRVEWATPKSK